jgi:hypothetical protein
VDVAKAHSLDAPPDVLPDSARRDVVADAFPDSSDRPDLPDVRPDSANADVVSDGPRVDLGRDSRAIEAGPLASCKKGDTYVLTLGTDKRFYRFDPSTWTLDGLASVSCGTSTNDSLNSMTVSTLGPAYVSTYYGYLCAVDLATFVAEETTYNPFSLPGLGDRRAFGMALLPDNVPAGQTLFVAAQDSSSSTRLARINLEDYYLTNLGPIVLDGSTTSKIGNMELTTGPEGELYGLTRENTSAQLLRIDPKTGAAVDVTDLSVTFTSSSIALVYWQGDFYLFLGMKDDSGTSSCEVYRYRKGDSAPAHVGTLGVGILGAGVATCR